MKSKYWFWAWTREITLPKIQPKAGSKGEIWDNLLIVSAGSAKEAFTKAEKIGKKSNGDCQGSLKLDGANAVTKFLGIPDLGLIHDKIGDGAEILFRTSRKTLSKANESIPPKNQLLDEVEKELASVIKAQRIPLKDLIPAPRTPPKAKN